MTGWGKDEDLAGVDEAGVGRVDEAVVVGRHHVTPIRHGLGIGRLTVQVVGPGVVVGGVVGLAGVKVRRSAARGAR